MMTLRERCLGLPYKDRINLCAALQESIKQERREGRNPNPSRGEILLDYLAEILGEPIPVKTRESRFVWARAMVAYQLTQEGFTTGEAGRMIGKDHSTIIHLRNKMKDALEYAYAFQDIIDIWKQFQNKLQDEIHRGTTQDLISLGGEFPDCSQGTMGKESGEIRTTDNL